MKYGISKVGYGGDEISDEKIVKVEVVEIELSVMGKLLATKEVVVKGSFTIQKVEKIIDAMANGDVFYTIKKVNNLYQLGAEVIDKNNEKIKFITTVPNSLKSDNLESLPRLSIWD